MSEKADRGDAQAAERRHDEERLHNANADGVRQLESEFASSLKLVKETMAALAARHKTCQLSLPPPEDS